MAGGSIEQDKALATDASGNPIQAILGCYAHNKDAGHPSNNCWCVFITNTATNVTDLTGTNTASGLVFKLKPGEVYRITADGNVQGSVGVVQICFGETAQPVSGDFPGTPGSAGIANATNTEIWSFNHRPYEFKALPGQIFMGVKMLTAGTSQPFFTIHKLS